MILLPARGCITLKPELFWPRFTFLQVYGGITGVCARSVYGSIDEYELRNLHLSWCRSMGALLVSTPDVIEGAVTADMECVHVRVSLS